MKRTILFYPLFFLLNIYFLAAQVPIPNGNFNNANDVNAWSLTSTTATKSWFNGVCQAMFIDNLPNNSSGLNAIITSPVFSIGLSDNYLLELEYGLLYTGTPAVFELVDANNNTISASSNSITSGGCSDWPSSKINKLVFSNLSSGDYQLRITIPKSQFFISNVNLEIHNPVIISGNINNTGCSNNNLPDNFAIKIINLADNSTAYTSTTNGFYSFTLTNTPANYLIEPVNNGSFVATPTGINVSVASATTNLPNNNFCFDSTISGIDVETSLTSETLARPGFTATYNLVYQNNGTTTTGNETITLNFDSSKLSYNTASVAPTSTTSNSITWNYSNLGSLESENIAITFNVLSPPTVNSGDVLTFSGNITPTSDANSSNNSINLDQTVVNSYDPNDVICLEGTEILPSQTTDYLTYRIRFQNTGTASAVNISVNTMLDNNLDATTFQPISSSHDYTTSLNGNELTYFFNNINLADSSSDEPNSHGWIFYKIKPKSSVVVGDAFNSSADIFFDFNPAVVTNTYTTTVENTLSTNILDINSSFNMYPNPTKNTLNIKAMPNSSYKVYDIRGKLLLKGVLTLNSDKINLKNIKTGMYFLKLTTTDKQQFVKKIVKL